MKTIFMREEKKKTNKCATARKYNPERPSNGSAFCAASALSVSTHHTAGIYRRS